MAKGKKVSRAFKQLMVRFCQSQHLGPVFERLPSRHMQNDLYKYLTMLLHSHRHNLEERVSETHPLDEESLSCSFTETELSVVRDVMYKYSRKASETFLRVPELCFLFAAFATHAAAEEFILSKIEIKGAEYTARMFREMLEIGHQAIASLRN